MYESLALDVLSKWVFWKANHYRDLNTAWVQGRTTTYLHALQSLEGVERLCLETQCCLLVVGGMLEKVTPPQLLTQKC